MRFSTVARSHFRRTVIRGGLHPFDRFSFRSYLLFRFFSSQYILLAKNGLDIYGAQSALASREIAELSIPLINESIREIYPSTCKYFKLQSMIGRISYRGKMDRRIGTNLHFREDNCSESTRYVYKYTLYNPEASSSVNIRATSPTIPVYEERASNPGQKEAKQEPSNRRKKRLGRRRVALIE